MKLVTGHVDLTQTSEVGDLFDRAQANRCAWVTGTGRLDFLPEGSYFKLWVPESQETWVAVREDVIGHDWKPSADQLEFENPFLGSVVLGEEADQYVTDIPLVELSTTTVECEGDFDLALTVFRLEPNA